MNLKTISDLQSYTNEIIPCMFHRDYHRDEPQIRRMILYWARTNKIKLEYGQDAEIYKNYLKTLCDGGTS